MLPIDGFYILLGQRHVEAVGLFAHLVAQRLWLLNTHTTALSDH